MAQSFSLRFYLNVNKTKGNEFKIYGRLIVDRKKSEFATNYFIEESKWDNAKGRAIRNSTINDELAELEAEINRIRRKLLDDDKPVTSKAIIDLLKGVKQETRSLLEFVNEHIEQIHRMGEHSRNTENHYKSSCNVYRRFITEKLRKKDVPLLSVDYDFLKQFDEWIMTEYTDKLGQNIRRNTVNKHHSRLRTILHKAIRENVITINPYSKFTLRNTPTRRSFLTVEEVNAIKALDFTNKKSLDRVRDIFLFSCFTSLRYSDAILLRMNDIIITEDKRQLISIQMEKTKESLYVPLIPSAQAIIDKYADDAARTVQGYVLPRYTNQKLNAYLKLIGTMAKTSQELTHHVARHTFATAALNQGMPMEVVQKILGHNNIRTTQIYAKMQISTLEREMDKFNL
jgi:integrase/recombinase XerD